MESSRGHGAPPPLSALRLLVSPIRLASAAVWQTLQLRLVDDYGMLEKFVSTVTDIIPELLTGRQRAQLALGLRARVILELCRSEATANYDAVQPHLDRMNVLVEARALDTGVTNVDGEAQSAFVDFVRHLLDNPAAREHFFQKVFLEDFGARYEEALRTLMLLLLSRLEKFLPLQTFQQVASTFGEVSSVLEDCMESMPQWEELSTLLHSYKDLGQLDHNDSLDDTCILSALSFAAVEKAAAETPRVLRLQSSASGAEQESSAPVHQTHVSEDQTSETRIDETDWPPGTNDVTGQEGNAEPQSRVSVASCPLKDCRVELERLDIPASLPPRPVRPNRGLRMKMILLEEKKGLHNEDRPSRKSGSGKRKSPGRHSPEVAEDVESGSFCKVSSYLAPISDSSGDGSWSYYSDEGSGHHSVSSPGSWSNYSSDASSYGAPASSSPLDNSRSSCSNKAPSLVALGEDEASGFKKRAALTCNASTPKRTRQFHCFICKEQLQTNLRSHMKIHFPNDDFACPRCGSRFKLLGSLKRHVKRVCYEHSQEEVGPDNAHGLYKCGKCEQAFKYKLSLDVHKRTHEELYCGVCRRVLRDTATLARHKASHTPFQCTRCDRTFTIFKHLLRHCENLHELSRPFACSHCPKAFSKLNVFIRHEWKHTGHLPFQCAQCGLRFKSDTDLVVHQRVHTGERPYLCTQCGKTFSHNSNMLRHLQFVHSESRNERKFPCSECDKSFKVRGALIKHQKTKHRRELYRHPCPYCGKMFSSSSISRHKLIHTGERPFKCTVPECQKHFRSNPEVKKHVLLKHSTERPYKCDACGKGFIKMFHLNIHSKVHSGEKPFVCHLCGKAFPKRYSMQRHRKLVHTLVKN